MSRHNRDKFQERLDFKFYDSKRNWHMHKPQASAVKGNKYIPVLQHLTRETKTEICWEQS
ncbi:hypothetical protein HKD37_19G053205 [Glycine soja]